MFTLPGSRGRPKPDIRKLGTSLAAGFRALAVGINNTVFGYLALASNTTGGSNTAIGASALTANTTGGSNVAVGAGSMVANTTGIRNIAIGQDTLAAMTTSGSNIAIGHAVMSGATGVGFNTIVGGGSIGTSMAAGADLNTGVGYEVFKNLTTGTLNAALGYRALSACLGGSDNMAIGANALASLTTGVQNAGIGFAAGFGITTSQGNTAIGLNTLALGACGDFNVAIGYQALTAADVGATDNVGIGLRAGQAITSGAYNTLVGAQAGFSITTGQLNTFLGLSAGLLFTTGQNNTCIGYNTDLQSATGDNQLNISNMIWGTGLSGVNAGKIGIGQATPLSLLHITGDNVNPTVYVEDYGGISRVVLRSCNGTRALPTRTLANGFLGLVGARGYGDTAFIGGNQARVSFLASEDTTDAHAGAYLTLDTIPNGSLTIAERLRVDNSGGISIGSVADAAASALLDVTSTTRGALMPRMTKTQRDAIASPATGLRVHNSTTQQPEFYNGARWLGAQTAANLAMHSYGGL